MEHTLSEKTLKLHKKEKSKIDLQMEKFGSLPEDYDSFVENYVFEEQNYIFYNSKKGKAYCTRCGNEFKLLKGMKLRHNEKGECPNCKKEFVCKSDGMGRQNLFSVQWSVLVQRHDEEVLVRYLCHTKDFRTDYRNPDIRTFEKFRTVHTVEMVMDYEWARFKSTYEYRWCNYKEIKGWWTPAEITFPRSAVLYNTDLAEVVAGTCMKYSAIDIYVDKVLRTRRFDRPWHIDWYFNSYRKKPYIEQFLKVGFFKLTEEVLQGEHEVPRLKHGRSIIDTLEISKTNFNMLRKIGNPSWKDVCILKYGQNLSMEEFSILRSLDDNKYTKWYEKYIDMRNCTTIYKLNKYIANNGIRKTDYFDYVRWLREMGYDMRNEFNLYPKNFTKAHDEKAKEYIRFKEDQAKEDEKKFKKLLKQLRKDAKESDAMDLKIMGLFIRLPVNTSELKKEGETLHHCVGTYVDRVARGETMIFFIRKEEEPDKPYFTLEYKNEKVIQCRGFKNCDMTPEVKAFTKIFEEKMQTLRKAS